MVLRLIKQPISFLPVALEKVEVGHLMQAKQMSFGLVRVRLRK